MSILKLKPAFKDYIWGGTNLISKYNKDYDGSVLAESWELSCHKDGPSVISNGDYKDRTLTEYINENGKEVLGENCKRFDDFPILIKFIDARDNLSIQVHPKNDYALKNEKQYGKTEVWYVADCKENAYLYYGFNRDITKEEFETRIKENTLLEVLNKVYVQKGDVLFIDASTIHAIGKDIIIAEIQQNSNVTYRVYDYGRLDSNGNGRDLHIEKAVDVTDLKKLERTQNVLPHISKCDYFTVDKIYLDGKKLRSLNGFSDNSSFVSILVLEGFGTIKNGDEIIEITKGDSLFIPANSGEFVINGNLEALMTTIDKKDNEVKICTKKQNDEQIITILDENDGLLYAKIAKSEKFDTKFILEALSENKLEIEDILGIYINSSENISVNEIKKDLPVPIHISNIQNNF